MGRCISVVYVPVRLTVALPWRSRRTVTPRVVVSCEIYGQARDAHGLFQPVQRRSIVRRLAKPASEPNSNTAGDVLVLHELCVSRSVGACILRIL